MLEFWDDVLTDKDKRVIEAGGWDEGFRDTREIGDRPAVVVIDVQRMMLGPDKPVYEAVDEYKTAVGSPGWRAVEEIAGLLRSAREHKVKVYFFRVPVDDPAGNEIPDEIKPEPHEEVIEKSTYSAFYGTDFVTRLVKDRIDTLVVVGGSTSGCVRATVTDADMRGFGVIVPPECVFDRIGVSHKATLLDIWMKRGRVMSRDEIAEYFAAAEATELVAEPPAG